MQLQLPRYAVPERPASFSFPMAFSSCSTISSEGACRFVASMRVIRLSFAFDQPDDHFTAFLHGMVLKAEIGDADAAAIAVAA